MTKNILNLPEVTGTPKSVQRFIAAGQQWLSLSSDNFERIQVRDAAERAQALALALGYREIAIQCSVLVAKAERVIVAETPVMQGKRTDLLEKAGGDQGLNFVAADNEVIKPQALRDMRAAHVGLTDQQFNEVQEQAVLDGEPLSRRKITAYAKQITKRDNPPAPKVTVPADEQLTAPLTTEEAFRNRILQLEMQLQFEIEDRDERIAIMAESEDAQAVEKRFDEQKELMRTNEVPDRMPIGCANMRRRFTGAMVWRRSSRNRRSRLRRRADRGAREAGVGLERGKCK